MRSLASLSSVASTLLLTALTLVPTTSLAETPPTPVPSGPFEFTDLPHAWQASKQSGDPMLLFVTSENCHFCHKMLRETLSSPKLLPAMRRLFETTSIRRDRHPQLIQQLGVRMYPTTLVVSPDNRLLGKIEGYVGPGEISARLNPMLASYRESRAAAATPAHRGNPIPLVAIAAGISTAAMDQTAMDQ